MRDFAVVPIVVNAGAAVLPTVMALLAGVAAMVLHPKNLVQAVRRRPWLASSIAAGIVAGIIFIPRGWRSLSKRHGSSPARTQTALQIDWAKVAEDILDEERRRERNGSTPSASTGPGGPPAPTPSEVPGAAGPLRQDFTRAFAQGDLSPSGLVPRWKYRPENAVFMANPAIFGNRIYAAASQSDLGGYTGLLACLDLETGRPLWQVDEVAKEPMPAFFSSPSVTADGKYVIIGQGLHQDRNCSLLCFEAATGKLHWAVKTPLHLESSPAIFGDVVVVGAGAIEGATGRPDGDPGYVFAVRISDGKQLWKQAVNDPESSPAIDDEGIVYIGSGFNGSAVVALRSASDEVLSPQKLERVLWRTAVTQPITAPVTLWGELAIVGGGNSDMVHSDKNAQGVVIALNRRTGAIVWQTRFEDAVLGSIAARGDVLICPLRTGEVAALSASDGRILWRARVSGSAPVLAGAAVTKDRVYAVSNDGYLAVLASDTGKVLEKIYLNEQGKPGTGLSFSSPQVIGNRVIVGSETGGLRAFEGTGAGK